MKPLVVLAALACAAAIAQAQVRVPPQPPPQMRGDGPPPEPRPFSITRADPALDAIVAPDAELELLADGFGLTEGPLWVPDGGEGYLLVSGLIDNVIYEIAADGAVSVFLDYAGYTGDDVNDVGTQTRAGRSHVILIGPSCTSRDSEGRIVWCADNDRAIMRLEHDGTRTVLADNHEGKRFGGPNDLAIKSDGSIYFTDNDFGLRGAGASPLKEMPNGVWRIQDGRTTRLLDRDALGGIPNGIAFSPDERYLYLSAGRVLKRYEVLPDGTLGGSIVFSEGDGIGDGIKTDRAGNVFSTSGAGPGIVRIMAPDGRLLGTLNLPIYGGEPKRQICATNVAFGGNDGRSLYITACDAVYRIRLRTPGIVPGPPA
ncbi:MAG TPA: SMP-30/gluconolactonase/LRE family protein [Gammaproteobacteria bacterium]